MFQLQDLGPEFLLQLVGHVAGAFIFLHMLKVSMRTASSVMPPIDSVQFPLEKSLTADTPLDLATRGLEDRASWQ